MRSYTHSAFAASLFTGIIQFFAIISVLGMAERLLNPAALVAVIPLSSTLLSFFTAVFLALLRRPTPRWLWALWLGAALLVFSIALWLSADNRIGAQVFADLYNPFALTLYVIGTLLLLLAMVLKTRFSVGFAATPCTPQLVTLVSLCIGLIVWHTASTKDVKHEQQNANNKSLLIGALLNKSLEDHTDALRRLKNRAEGIPEDAVLAMLAADFTYYSKDFEAIEGMILLDDALNVVKGDDFSLNFHQGGYLSTPGVSAWLKNTDQHVKFAANANTLRSAVPVLMITTKINSAAGTSYIVVALLNMNMLIEKRYVAHLSAYETYVELTPDMLYATNGEGENITSLEALLATYRYYTIEKVPIQNLVTHNVYSFLRNQNALQKHAVINQFIIWLSLLFTYIFILVSTKTQLLSRQSRQLQTLANVDELTGLLRRDALHRQLLSRAAHVHGSTGIVFVNLDGFSAVNNSLGHGLGDALLAQIAWRIEQHCTHATFIARYGNDEFVVYYENLSKATIEQQAQGLLTQIAEVYLLGEINIHLTASIGIALQDEPHQNIKLLIQQAQIAMGQAKRHGANQLCFYHNAMDEQYQQIVWIRGELQKALKRQALQVYYQPVYCIASNTIVGAESLVRWQHNGEFISPALFIPVAEQTGQILQVGDAVCEKVLSDIAQHPALQAISIAINFSPQQFQQQRFLEKLTEQVTRRNIQPAQLTVEVTETVMTERTRIDPILRALIAEGFNVAIDDFGTGYSSLSYLSKQPANIIKIDRAFTLDAEQPGQEQGLLSSVINMCSELDKTIVVEGVETQAMLTYLRRFNNIRVQGYIYAAPMPLAELLVLLRQQAG